MIERVAGFALAALLLALSFTLLYQSLSGILELVARVIAG